jgi:hypothetical protein
MPDNDTWEHAEQAYAAADRALAAAPQPSIPQPIREAMRALGGLVGNRPAPDTATRAACAAELREVIAAGSHKAGAEWWVRRRDLHALANQWDRP